MHMMMFSVDF